MDENALRWEEHGLVEIVENHETENLQGYLNAGGDPDVCVDNKRWTLLHKCVCQRFAQGVQLLLENGASPHTMNAFGVAPLHTAAKIGDEYLVSLLLIYESVEVRSKGGLTPALYAAWGGSVATLGILLDAEATLSSVDVNGNTLLHFGVESRHVDMVQFIISCGVSLHTKNRFGIFPIHNAACTGDANMVDLLLDYGAGIDCRSRSGESSLFIAATKGFESLARHLVRQGAELSTLSGAGWSALFVALWYQHWPVVYMLFRQGAQVRGPRRDLLILLHALVVLGRVDCVHIMLETALSDLCLRTNYGVFLLYEALHWCRDHVAAELIRRGIPCDGLSGSKCLALAIHRYTILAVKMLMIRGVNVGRMSEGNIHPLNVAILSRNFAAAIELIDNSVLIDEGPFPQLVVPGSVHPDSPPLFLATTVGAEQIVELLWERGASPRIFTDVATALHAAAASPSVEILRSLLVNGAPIDARDSMQQTPLHWAANGSGQSAYILSLHGAQVDLLDKNGDSPLFSAIEAGNVKVVSTLLGRGADCNSYGSLFVGDESLVHGSIVHGYTPLCCASTTKETKIVKILLENGADVNKTDVFGVSPLGHASGKGNLKIMSLLRRRGAVVTPLCLRLAVNGGQDKAIEYLLRNGEAVEGNLTRSPVLTKEMVQSLLCEACSKDHIPTVKALLASGARVHHSSKDTGPRALYSAVFLGHHIVTNFLLEQGANVEAPMWELASALHVAARMGHCKAVETLLECGWYIDSRGNEGITPLMLASTNIFSSPLLSLLIKQGADAGLRNSQGANTMHCTAWSGVQANVRDLLEAGCPIDAQSEDGSTPLNIAAMEGWTEIVADLSLLGADLDIPDINGRTPLFTATRSGHRNVVATLLGRGATANIKDILGASSLHIAAMRRDIKMIKLLLHYGADANQEDRYGYTAMNLALGGCCSLAPKVTNLLLRQGTSIDNLGQRPPLYDAFLSGSAALVCLLLDQGAIIDAMLAGTPPLHRSWLFGSDMRAILLERGHDLQLKAYDGSTALHWSASAQCIHTVGVMLKRGISIDDRRVDGLSSLCIAAMEGCTDVMELLIEEGASIKSVNKSGGSALFHASQNGQDAAVRLLLDKDAGICLDLAEEKSPLIIAARNGLEDVVNTIMEAIDNGQYEYRERELNSAWHLAQQNEHEDVANMLGGYLESGNVKDTRYDMCYNSGDTFADSSSSLGEVFVETILNEGEGAHEENPGTALKLICW